MEARQLVPNVSRGISKIKKDTETDVHHSKCFLDLPNETLSKIGSYLNEYDLFWNFGFTCQRLREIALATVKIIDLCKSPISIAEKQFQYVLKHDEVIQSIKHIWVGSDLIGDVRQSLKQMILDSKEKYCMLAIDYRLFTSDTCRIIEDKFDHLQSLLVEPNKCLHSHHDCFRVYASIFDCIKDCTKCGFLKAFYPLWLRRCKELKTFIMNDCIYVDDSLMITLSENCKYLKYICLDHCTNVSNTSIMAIAYNCVNMEVLSLRNTKVTNESIEAIAENCPELRTLNLRNCSISSKAIVMVAENCRHLQNLDITRVPGPISLECLRQLAKKCLDLRIIHLDTYFAGSISNLLAGTGERRLFVLRRDCIHCWNIVRREVPVLAKEIGLNVDQLCLEGLILNRNPLFPIADCLKHKLPATMFHHYF